MIDELNIMYSPCLAAANAISDKSSLICVMPMHQDTEARGVEGANNSSIIEVVVLLLMFQRGERSS